MIKSACRLLALALAAAPFVAIYVGYTGYQLIAPPPAKTAQVEYLGHREEKGCAKCHEPQWESWAETKHAKAIDSLKPGEAVGAKRDAGLDPDKDFTEDPDCLKCHVTGLDEGGYEVGNRRAEMKYYGVGCETCHGPGGDYQPIKDSYPNDDFPREEVIAAGMMYAQLETCTPCHNTDEDNPFPEPDFLALTYDDGLVEAHDHIKQEKHPPREETAWLYEE